MSERNGSAQSSPAWANPRAVDVELRKKVRSPAIFLAIGLLMMVVLVTSQLYFFMKLQAFVQGLDGAAKTLTVIFGTSFLVFCWIAALRYSAMMVFAYLGWTETVRPRNQPKWWPRVTILVPAYNEVDQIEASIRSLLELDYPDLEILVIDDGSQDGTLEVAREVADSNPTAASIQVLRKPNGGKYSALNLGYRYASGELVLCVDADSRLETDALGLLVSRIQEPNIGAVAGQVRVRNRKGFIPSLQALEYSLMNGMPRLAQSFFSYVLIAPGPVALFERSVLDQVFHTWEDQRQANARRGRGHVDGPWESDTFAEDCDITMNVLLLGKRVVFEPDAISWTTAPTWLYPLLNQRYRWIRGNIQAMRKAWSRWRAIPSPPSVLPLWLLIFFVESILWPLVSIYGLVLFVALLLSAGQPGTVLPWFVFLLLVEANAGLFCLRATKESYRLILFAPLFRIYSVLLDVNTVTAVGDEALGQRMTWL